MVYDTLLVLHPYRHMVSEVSDSVALEPGARVLDAGCGTGNVTGQLLRAGYRVTAIDASGGMLQRARCKSPGATVEAVDLNERLPYPEHTFDAVTCSNVLYSLREPAATLAEMRRVLKPGGRLALSNPGKHFSMGAVLKAHWSVSDSRGRAELLLAVPKIVMLAVSNLFLLNPAKKKLLFFAAPEELRALLQQAGFENIEVRPCYGEQGYLVTAEATSSC